MKIEGKVAIVVGGVQGIGKACVELLVAKGAKVCLADLNEDKGKQVAKELNSQHGNSVHFVKCDVCSDADVEKLFSKSFENFSQSAEIVLTTAGILEERNWQKCLDVNVGGCVRLVNAALNHLGKDKGGTGGVVLLTSSVAGIQPAFWGPVYSASKHAVTALARSWADDANYKLHGIRFNTICPATVDTPFLSQITNAYHVDYHHNKLAKVEKFTPDKIAGGFIQLTEDDNANGQALRFSKESGISCVAFPDAVYN